MTIADAVHIHGISERTWRRWIRAGHLPATKVGRTTLVPPHAAELLAHQSRNRGLNATRQRWGL